MPNRFEQVDEIQPDAITLILEQRGDGRWAKVHCPAYANSALREDKTSEDMAPKDALASAVKLANEFKAIGLPTTLLIDRQGREIGRLIGPAEWDDADAKALVLAALAAK